MTRDAVYAFLKLNKLAVLATTGPNRTPQAAFVGVAVTPDLELVFDTLSTSRKYANLRARPACALSIGWTGEQTIQYEGYARILCEPDEFERYQPIYFEAWPDGPSRLSWPGISYVVVRPRWIRLADYSAQPFRIEELNF